MAESLVTPVVADDQLRPARRSAVRWATLLPLLAAGLMLAGGFWLRWPSFNYRGLPEQHDFNNFAFDRFSYSDIPSLYFRDKLRSHPRPYFDYRLEYPVGIGLMIYVFNFATRLRPYFLWTSFFLAACGLGIAWLIPRFPRGRVWLFALSPALAFYVNLNWDMAALLLTVFALLLFVRGRDGLGAAFLAAGVWTKFFPIVILPLIVAERARAGRWREGLRLAVVFGLVSLVINAPLLILRPRAWLYFFEVSRTRPREVNLWSFFDRWHPTTGQINTLTTALLLAAIAALTWAVWRGGPHAFLPASCAAIAWFLFVNKVYSPQYSLWVVVLLAVVGAPPALAVGWSAADLLYFGASFLILGLIRFSSATSWFFPHGLIPAMAIREGTLLAVAGWCLWRVLADGRLSRIERYERAAQARSIVLQ